MEARENSESKPIAAALLAASRKRTEETEKLYSIELPEEDEIADPLNVCFLDRVETDYLVWAIRQEYRKSGKLIEPESFGKYRRLLDT